jgi:TolB-like protein
MPETRRLAAIMAVDVVAYSRLMGDDEAGTARDVREHRDAARPLIADKGGRIVKTMGDGLLLEFPSVVAAVECAVAMQKLMAERNADTPEAKRIVYRIGVNLGDVLIEGDDIIGEGVNIAARLEGISEPGGVMISSTAYDHVRGKIDAQFVDLGETSLKNIARRVRTYAVKFGAAPKLTAAALESHGPPHVSLVVLPFANLGGGVEHEYFVDGMTESLTTDLSRIFRGAFVIGRHTAFTYKGKDVDLKHIGRELNVRYVLEGSVQRGGNRMRVNVQLIDAKTGDYLWTERFDKPLADLFDMQDEIVARLANTLSAQMVGAEARRAERSSSPNSTDLVFRAQALMNKGFTPENVSKARDLYAQALALDSDDISALTGVASADLTIATVFIPDDRVALLTAAEQTLTRVISLAPESAIAHFLLGILQSSTNRVAQGIRELERALDLEPNLARAHGQIGMARILLGRPEETEAHIREALRLSPRDPVAHLWCGHAGLAKLIVGKFKEAETWLRRSIEINPNDPTSHFYLSCALVYLGRLPEARSEASVGVAINPTYTLARVRASASSNPTFIGIVDRYVEALSMAGVPEQ